MSLTLRIGTWIEHEARRVTHCPTSYAADTETLLIERQSAPLNLMFESGYLIPMPYWLLVGLKATRIEGRTYSGFGGVNFASREMTAGEAVEYTIQAYSYQLQKLVDEGTVIVHEEWRWLLKDRGALYEYIRAEGWTWERLARAKEAQG